MGGPAARGEAGAVVLGVGHPGQQQAGTAGSGIRYHGPADGEAYVVDPGPGGQDVGVDGAYALMLHRGRVVQTHATVLPPPARLIAAASALARVGA